MKEALGTELNQSLYVHSSARLVTQLKHYSLVTLLYMAILSITADGTRYPKLLEQLQFHAIRFLKGLFLIVSPTSHRI